ncbi:hypothetical protein VD659_04585 [Herbiconiux sp. 11R-BC]|uniref:hypothetical protein n=1 Tax=Herbiconiux sp. 11R-BC TaxID=3111637 RepID=UPI003C032EB1
MAWIKADHASVARWWITASFAAGILAVYLIVPLRFGQSWIEAMVSRGMADAIVAVIFATVWGTCAYGLHYVVTEAPPGIPPIEGAARIAVACGFTLIGVVPAWVFFDMPAAGLPDPEVDPQIYADTGAWFLPLVEVAVLGVALVVIGLVTGLAINIRRLLSARRLRGGGLL